MKDPIITSILDTDLYKITMMQAVWNQYPKSDVYYEFKCRNTNVSLYRIKDELIHQINSWKNLELTKKEMEYLLSLDFIKSDFVYFLKNYRIDPNLVLVEDCVNSSGDKDLKISCKGKWIDTILFEILILSTVNELFFDGIITDPKDDAILFLKDKVEENKIIDYPTFKFAEFGTRRRYSKEIQKIVLEELIRLTPNQLIGTSNVKLASVYGIKPIGTVAHEWTMAHLGLTDNISQAQGRALHVWKQEYGSRLGIALTDTFGTDAFINDFDFTLARAYDGVRHDSGDPIVFGEKIINYWNSIGIDPRRKSIVFSDGLNFPEALRIWRHFTGRTNVSFGIGTYLTNDVGTAPLNIVMKLLSCNETPCVKLSDVNGKEMGDKSMIKSVKSCYGIL